MDEYKCCCRDNDGGRHVTIICSVCDPAAAEWWLQDALTDERQRPGPEPRKNHKRIQRERRRRMQYFRRFDTGGVDV